LVLMKGPKTALHWVRRLEKQKAQGKAQEMEGLREPRSDCRTAGRWDASLVQTKARWTDLGSVLVKDPATARTRDRQLARYSGISMVLCWDWESDLQWACRMEKPMEIRWDLRLG
jgi:hypothetical protein